MFGFGARINNYSNNLSHCFALNGNVFRPEVFDLHGINQTYQNSLQKVAFSGPTYFAPILQNWNEIAKFSSKNSNKYFVYLILTDGVIHDMEKTIDEIVISSELPISIIIIGIGFADFSAMD